MLSETSGLKHMAMLAYLFAASQPSAPLGVGVECGYTHKEDTDDGPSAVADRGLHYPGSRWVCAACAEDTVLEDGEGNLIAQALDSIRDLYGELFSESPRLHGEVLNRVTKSA
jgi:hypothetical protein